MGSLWKILTRPSARPLIVLIGVDGAGKTTVAQRLLEHYSALGVRGKIVYMGVGRDRALPGVRDLASKVGVKVPLPKEVGASPNRWRRGLYFNVRDFTFLLDGLFRYLFYLIPQMARGNVVIADRYAYDLLLQHHVGRWTRWLLVACYPRPAVLIHLHQAPKVLYARKGERGEKELARQQGVIEALQADLARRGYKRGVVIEASELQTTLTQVLEFCERWLPDLPRSVEAARGRAPEPAMSDEALMSWLIQLHLGDIAEEARILKLCPKTRDDWLAAEHLARANVLTVRTFERLRGVGINPKDLAFDKVLEGERKRREATIALIDHLGETLEALSVSHTVIKTLDQYPDLGHDIDMLVSANAAAEVSGLMIQLGGTPMARSVCDKLAAKASFRVEDLKVEWHMGRMGQVGEDPGWATEILGRRQRWREGDGFIFVPSLEDRLLIQVLHRFYRHFFVRLCDVVNTVHLLRNYHLDWNYVKATARSLGILPGVLLYLNYVQTLLEEVGGSALDLVEWWPELLDSRFKSERLTIRGPFLRFPRGRVACRLYLHKVRANVIRMHGGSLARLALLPMLATCEMVSLKVVKRSVVW